MEGAPGLSAAEQLHRAAVAARACHEARELAVSRLTLISAMAGDIGRLRAEFDQLVQGIEQSNEPPMDEID